MNSLKNKAFELGGQAVLPGETRQISLSVGTFSTHEELMVQATVIHGKKPGPVLLIMGCVHGDEFNGAEIIRRALRSKQIFKLKGTLIAVPIVNRPGFISRSRYMPDRRDLNRLFPGSAKGPLGGRLAKVITDSLIQKSDCVIDFHTGAVNRENLPQIRINPDDERALELAKAFGSPMILSSKIIEGSVRSACHSLGKTSLLFEGGEALRFDGASIRYGVQGIVAVMRSLGMLPQLKSKKISPQKKTVLSYQSYWERAPEGGLFIPLQVQGKAVREGDLLGLIGDPQGDQEVEIRAKLAGIIIGRTNEAVADEGDGLFHIAKSANLVAAESTIIKSTDAMAYELDEANDDHPV